MISRSRLLLAALVALSIPVTVSQAAVASTRPHATASPVGHALTVAEVHRIDRPIGRRVSAGTTSETTTSTNWSGLAESGTSLEGASGSWVIPTVVENGDGLVAQWVGIDGFSNESLIQTGTVEDAYGDTAAWFELLPENPYAIDLSNAPVNPGDVMNASVNLTTTPGVWEVYLADVTGDWYFEQTMSYDGPETSAEWIVEAPTVLGGISDLADFGSTTFTQTSVYGDFGVSGTTWYGTDMDASNEIDMVDSTGAEVIASPSAPSADPVVGQDFTDTYSAPPPSPAGPSVHILSPTDNFELSTLLHVDYHATDSTSPISSYNVRYQTSKWNSSSFTGYIYPSAWQGAAVHQQTLIGTPGVEYCFSVQATSKAGGTSAWSDENCATIPLGAGSLSTVAPHQWSKRRSAGYFLDSYAITNTAGAELRIKGAWGQIGVVAAKCPTCGIIQVLDNGKVVAQFNLHAATVEHNQIFIVKQTPFVSSTVIMRSENTKTVIVEGIGTR